MPSPDEVAAVRAIYEDLAQVTSQELAALWDALGSYDCTDIPRLTRQARPLVVASSRTAARTQAALVGNLAPDVADIAAKRLTLVEQPFHATWHALSQHRPYEEAIRVGQSAMEAYGRDVPYGSAREAMTLATNGRFLRSISPTACEWCHQFEGVEFATADAATFGHDRCDCIVVPAL